MSLARTDDLMQVRILHCTGYVIICTYAITDVPCLQDMDSIR